MTSDRPGRTLYPHVLGLVTPLAVERAVGAPYLSVADWLRTWTTWTDEDRAAWQQERLTATVAHAAQHVPYYRRRLGHRRPETVTLAELPVVDKATIRRDMDAFLSRGWRSIAHIDKQTGGTTGDPWRYPLDRAAWTHMYAANLHLWERTGYRYGERVVRLGAPEFLGRMRNSPKSQVRSWFERHDTTLTGFDIGPAASLRRALRAGRRPAALWYGYPFTLAAMAEAVLEHQPQIQRPRAVVTTGEMLEPSLLHSIRAAFGPRVYDQYGCNDGGVLAQTCQRGRYHLAENVSLVEVLDDDDRPCPPGVEGDVTVTNLHARTLPFLRYQVGDRAVLGDGPCPCGTPGRTLERITGRHGDRVVRPDGETLSVLGFVWVFHCLNEVHRWQVVQTSPTALKVRYDAPEWFDPRPLEERLRSLCGSAMTITLAPSEPIEQTPHGKHPVVIVDEAATAGLAGSQRR